MVSKRHDVTCRSSCTILNLQIATTLASCHFLNKTKQQTTLFWKRKFFATLQQKIAMQVPQLICCAQQNAFCQCYATSISKKKKPSGWLPKGFTLCKSSVCKPSSVLNGYLSTAVVTDSLQRIRRDAEPTFDLISCTEWGLHARVVTKACVGSYPAFPPLQRQALRYISVALSLKSPSQAVSLHSCSVVLGLSS